jgi:hypothetical protein
MSDDNSWLFTSIVIIWLILITIFLVGISVAVFQGRIELGPTGPTGPKGDSGATLTNTSLGLNQTLLGNTLSTCQCNQVGLNACNQVGLNACNQVGLNACNQVTSMPTCHCHSGGVGSVLNTASCLTCNFNTVNGISQFQVIEGNNVPQIINFVLTTNVFSYDGMGTFTLPVGQYQLTTTVVYTNNNLNNTKSVAVWLRDNTGNVISSNDLIGGVTNSQTQQITKSISFVVNSNKNRLSVLTWHQLNMNETIDNRTQFVLRRI